MKFQSNYFNLLIGLFVLSLLSLANSREPTKEYSSYRPVPVCNPSSYFRYPKTEQDVVDIVKEAIAKNETVKAFGVRHSQTDIICTEGIPIDNQGLQFFQMNDDNVTATFGAGVNLREVTTFLRKHGRALRTTPAYGNITIGGALGTGSHGSTIKYNSSLSSQVVCMRIVDGNGNIQDISDPEDLKAFKVHVGLLGIVLKATLYTVPLYKTLANNYVISDEILTNGEAIRMAQNADQMSLYWFPEFNEVIVADWTIVDANTPGNAFTYDHVPSTYEVTAIAIDTIKEAAFTLTSSMCALASSVGYTILHVLSYILKLALLVQVPLWVPIYTENSYTVKMPAVGYYDVMFAPICYDTPQGILKEACVWDHGPNNATLLDNEMSVDLADLPKFIAEIKDIVSKAPTAFPVQGILMRFSGKSDIYMSTAYGRQSVDFEFYLLNRKDRYNQPSGSLAGYQTILQLLRNKYRARSHWGKTGLAYHNSESIDLKLDPEARKKFVVAMNKFDPNEVFINNFGRRIKNTGTKVDLDPKITHCALLDNCFCSKNNDCGDNQICTNVDGYTYRVCKTKNEVTKNFFPKFILPNATTNVWSFLTTKTVTLATALLSKCSFQSVLDALGRTTVDTLDPLISGIASEVKKTAMSVIDKNIFGIDSRKR